MSKKTNYTIRLILGMYLTFIGVNLIRETLASHPSDLAFKIFMGILFTAIGAGYVIWIIKRMIASKKAEQEEQKREEAAETALRKMEQRRERVAVQSRTAPMPSLSELEAAERESDSEISDSVNEKESPSKAQDKETISKEASGESTIKETVVRSSVSLDIDDTENEEETDYEEK